MGHTLQTLPLPVSPPSLEAECHAATKGTPWMGPIPHLVASSWWGGGASERRRNEAKAAAQVLLDFVALGA